MGGIIALLIWHVNRQWSAQVRLRALQQADRHRSQQRENAARFGSHEVRTRLTIARGYAQLIADQSTELTVREDAELVVAELIKASALATNLLTLVRVVEPPNTEPVDVDRMLAAILRRWSVTADRNWNSRSAVGTVQGDNERLEAILDCLLENAVRFTGPGDTIAMTADAQGDELVLIVRDTGVGIPSTDLDSVFEVFRTGSTAGERAGSGLGLAIVKAVTEARGGTVAVASSLGHGTAFTLRLPLRPAPPATLGKTASASADRDPHDESVDVRS
ncbi:HAMP domain-containing sensor histidine kinase [Arthrobacter sp. LAPM80]|uniref:sensor histidine kinase n=1 Tax=Arthrobacter sp. LAPM80 TaxID=3141788 RepID=UPI00398AB761